MSRPGAPEPGGKHSSPSAGAGGIAKIAMMEAGVSRVDSLAATRASTG